MLLEDQSLTEELLANRWNIPEKPVVNFEKVMELKNSELQRLSKLYKGNLDSAGVTFIEGRGKVTGPNSVEVNGKSYKVASKQNISLSYWPPYKCAKFTSCDCISSIDVGCNA